MATESPLISDGSQTVASVNMANGAGLSGNGGSGQFYAVQITGTRTTGPCSALGQAVYGICQNKPSIGDANNVGVFGVSKMIAGGTINAGQKLMTSAAGLIMPWVAGSGYQQLGVALESAVAGQIFSGFVFGPGGPQLLT